MHSVAKHQSPTAVELFCGIGGFRLACDELGIKTVWANDASEDSCAVYARVFGGREIVEGQIEDNKHSIPRHDLLTAGFPCQPFSSAGKKQGIRDPRGTLFEQIVTVLRAHHPQWFVLENVKRLLTMEHGDHFAAILQALSKEGYDVEWRLLRAHHFGLPQNRQRVFIVGRRASSRTDFRVCLAQPDDLAEVVAAGNGNLNMPDKWRPLAEHRAKFPEWGICRNDRFYAADLDSFAAKAPDVSLSDVLEAKPSEEFFMDESTNARLATSVRVDRTVGGVRILYNQKGGARMGYTVFGIDGLAPALTASHSRHYERYQVGKRFRRLTHVEYARLQGFPDSHCYGVSPFNQYGLFGNAVPPPMAKWVISQLVYDGGIDLQELPLPAKMQLSLAI
jgi:DNA (cytosine-5)-methyltransferase 1